VTEVPAKGPWLVMILTSYGHRRSISKLPSNFRNVLGRQMLKHISLIYTKFVFDLKKMSNRMNVLAENNPNHPSVLGDRTPVHLRSNLLLPVSTSFDQGLGLRLLGRLSMGLAAGYTLGKSHLWGRVDVSGRLWDRLL
jgi:hypothetical protein